MRLSKRLQAWKPYIFFSIWTLSTTILGWQLLLGHHTFDSEATPLTLLALLICTIALLWWLTAVVPDLPPNTGGTRRGKFVLVVTLAITLLLLVHALVGRSLLFALPLLALIVLALQGRRLSGQEMVYALLLALVAGIAGLSAGWVTISRPIWAVLQVALVLPSLLAGWAILRRTRLLQDGVGHSLLVSRGPAFALRGFAQGVMIAMPWAFGLVVLGSANEELWVQRWWQPFVAIQPGISEEAWGRVLLVPLLFLIFRPMARSRTALTTALVVMAYWFAYLHTSGGFESIASTLMIGTLFTLPTSYLWLRRGLETAVGFHFWLDFIKFVAAYLLNRGLWIS